MSESTVKCRKRYVDHPRDISKGTSLIHGPGHSSDECKVLGDFDYKYSKSGLLSTAGMTTKLKISLTVNKRTMLLLIMQWMRSY